MIGNGKGIGITIMNIRVWSSFSKRPNSTKQPAAADGRQISCVLKEETSLRNPSFILYDPMPSITYVQAFGNYYFVTDIINIDAHRAEVACSLDVLATYRSSILGYTAFVERSASNYDIYLRDPLLSSQQKYISDTMTSTALTGIFAQAGMYVIPVMTKRGGHSIYCTNTLEFLKGILNSGCYDATDIAEWISSKVAASFDLDVYIGAIKWMPMNIAQVGIVIPNNQIAIGPVMIKPEFVPDGTLVKSVSATAATGVRVPITLPAAYYGDFRDADPEFVQYSITLPGIGTAPLDPAFVGSCILNGTAIYDQMAIDIATGLITHIIETGTGAVKYCNFKGSIAVDIPIGKARANTIETIAAFIGGMSSAVSNLAGGGGSPGSVVSGVGDSLLTGLSVIKSGYCPQVSMVGGSGNHYDLYLNCENIRINRKVFGSKQFPLAVAGRPLMQNVQLSTLSGFCKCGNASVPVNARDADRAEINAYLNSGFYIE